MTNDEVTIKCTAFLRERAIAAGPLDQVVAQVKNALDEVALAQVLIFDDATGKQIEVDFRGTRVAVSERPEQHPHAKPSILRSDSDVPRQVGRPRLGVVPGEVTLLPRHWAWLKSQPGGASVTLRKLIDEARRVREKQTMVRAAQERTYRFMTTMAGDFPYYEDALRSLYAGDAPRFHAYINSWAADISAHIKTLAAEAFSANGADS